MALVSQRGEHPFDGTVRHGGEVDPLTVDKMRDNIIPRFPEDTELGGTFFGCHGRAD